MKTKKLTKVDFATFALRLQKNRSQGLDHDK